MPVDAPWSAAQAGEWDAKTLEQYIDENAISDGFKQLASIATRPIFGAEAREVSLLYTLFYIASSGNEENIGTFERNFNTRDGAQNYRFEGGSQLISQTTREEAAPPAGSQVAGAAHRAGQARRHRPLRQA